MDLPLGNLPETCEIISKHIQSTTETLLFEELLSLKNVSGQKAFHSSDNLVCILDGLPHIFRAQPGPLGSETFYLGLLSADIMQNESQSLEFSLPLSETTPFKHVVMRTESRSASVAQDLSTLCRNSLDAGYQWLEQFCISAVEKDKAFIIDELYRVIRSAVPEHCTESVWLYMLAKNKSVYVFDKIAQSRILKSSRLISSRFEQAPSDTLAKLAGRVAKPETTSDFRRAIPEDRTYINDPFHGDSEGTLIALPQYILMGGENHCVQPLVGKESGTLEGNAIWLTAVYPIPMRESVEKGLSETRLRLAKLLQDHRSVSRTILNKINRVPIIERLAPYSEILAPFLRESIKAFKP